MEIQRVTSSLFSGDVNPRFPRSTNRWDTRLRLAAKPALNRLGLLRHRVDALDALGKQALVAGLFQIVTGLFLVVTALLLIVTGLFGIAAGLFGISTSQFLLLAS